MKASMATQPRPHHWGLPFGLLVLLVPAVLMSFFYAPTEATMGQAQRIVYLHVPMAWCGLAGCLTLGFCGTCYLFRRNLAWDHWAQAAAEVGWLCCTLNLITGSLWARQAWGVWWTWEPRLTFTLVLWLIYAGYFLLRAGLDEPHRRARVSAVLALLGVADVPLILMATRWFRGVHPVAPEMDPRMRVTLLVSGLSFVVFFALLTRLRRHQLDKAEQCAVLEAQEPACLVTHFIGKENHGSAADRLLDRSGRHLDVHRPAGHSELALGHSRGGSPADRGIE
ncbi:MAG: cytochrome c biogenesis protein [Gemmataceae bacterium]